VPADTWPATGDKLPDACADQQYALMEQTRKQTHRVLHTLFGASQTRYTPIAEHLERSGYPDYPPLTDDHIVLLRIEDDEMIGQHHVACDHIAFWIRKSDLHAGVFDNVTLWTDQS